MNENSIFSLLNRDSGLHKDSVLRTSYSGSEIFSWWQFTWDNVERDGTTEPFFN